MHISQLHKLAGKGEFSMAFVDESGAVVEVAKCVCTSFHSKGNSMRIKIIESEVIRRVIRVTIIRINNKELYI